MTDQTLPQNPYTPPQPVVPPVQPPPPPPPYNPPVHNVSNIVSATPQHLNKSTGSGKGAIIIGASVLALGAVVFGITKFTGLFSKASGEDSCVPSAIAEEQITPNSATVVFQTPTACQVEISYGTSPQVEALLLQVPEAMASLNHNVKLSPLLPSTTYYYQLKVGGKAVGNVRNFLTSPSSGAIGQTTVAPTTPPVIPTQVPAKSIYTIENFQVKFGSTDPAFDTDKNGIVNFGDWVAYQKTLK